MSDDSAPLLSRCLSLDLEVGVEDDRIRALAGVRPDTGQSVIYPAARESLASALARLDGLSEGAEFLLGHNLIDFDLPRLQAANPGLRLLQLPAVDTLMLNPLAFPRNPYHHLVKHYQDGQLKRGRINDPNLDARLALQVFVDQQKALREMPQELLAAWHWLTTLENGQGFDMVFTSLRRSPRPSDSEAHDAIRSRLAGISCRTHAREAMEMRPAMAGHWPTPWRGSRYPAATLSCLPGCAISFQRRDSWSAFCATPPVPIPAVNGAGSGTTPGENLPVGSALPNSARSRRTRTDAPCSSPS